MHKISRVCRYSTRHLNTINIKRINLTDKPKYSLCRQNVNIIESNNNYLLLLDDRVLATPLGNDLTTSSVKLINAIKLEWENQINKLTSFKCVPLTLLLSETLDFIGNNTSDKINTLLDLLDTDTLLFFKDNEHINLPNLDVINEDKLKIIKDLDLNTLQSTIIKPILDKFSEKFNINNLILSDNISKCPIQSQYTKLQIRIVLQSLKLYEIIALSHIQKHLKSLILPLMLIKELISIPHALRISRLEETLEASRWGITDDFIYTEDLIHKHIHNCISFISLSNTNKHFN